MWELLIKLLRWLFGTQVEDDKANQPETKSSTDFLQFLTELEGSYTRPYKDPVGLWTIGVGHLIKENDHVLALVAGPGEVTELTTTQVRQLLALDLQEFIKGVNSTIRFSSELPQHKLDALVSFTFNVGLMNLRNSTLIRKLLDRESDASVASEFLRWTKAGRPLRNLKGLQIRRAAEATIYRGLKIVPSEYLVGLPVNYHARIQQLVSIYWGE